MVCRTSQLRRVLAKIDPEGVRRLKKRTEKKLFEYDVKGPRSLYHLDGHEKLAKGWGIWIDRCIDGYNRYIGRMWVVFKTLLGSWEGKHRSHFGASEPFV
jgi:hypothetical protein